MNANPLHNSESAASTTYDLLDGGPPARSAASRTIAGLLPTRDGPTHAGRKDRLVEGLALEVFMRGLQVRSCGP